MRGMRNKKAEEGKLPKSQLLKKRCSLTWAILIKMVFEVVMCTGGPIEMLKMWWRNEDYFIYREKAN